MNLTYYSRTQSSLDLTFPLGFVQTPVSICTQRHQILQIRTAAVYIHSAKWEYLHKEPRLWRIKHPQPAASKNHEINSLSIYQISVPFFEHQHHHQLDDAWHTLPPPPPQAVLGTELKLLTLKPQKRVPELTVPTQLRLGVCSYQPCFEGQWLCSESWVPLSAHHSWHPRMSPSLMDRWLGQTLEGAGARLPWISAGAGRQPRWISSSTCNSPLWSFLGEAYHHGI